MQINLITAFLAGITSFFAPCTFMTLPVFLTYMSMLGGDVNSNKQNKHQIIISIIYYVIGFVLIFVFLGVGVAGISRHLISNKTVYVQIGGGFLIILASFILIGNKFKRLTFLYQEKKIHVGIEKIGTHPFTPFILGITNGLSWSPCIGPILGAILFLASTANSVFLGTLYLFAYALGITLPLIIFAIFFEKLLPKFHLLKRYSIYIYNLGTILILIMGMLFITGYYDQVSGLIYRYFPLANSAL